MSDLPRENVFGHTHKVMLFRSACAALREDRRALRILDVGCGSGYAVTRFLGEQEDEVLGIDLHEPSIAFAKRHFERHGVRFECRSAESIKDSKQKFDVVILADILEHLDEPLEVLKACHALLNDAGLLLVTVPNGLGPFEIESAISRLPVLGHLLLRAAAAFVGVLNRFGPLKGTWTAALAEAPADLPYNAESGHVQFFSCRALRHLMDTAGFDVIDRRNLSFLSGPFTNTLFNPFIALCRLNVKIARTLPAPIVSGWFFKARVSGR